jgi:hypothetical protein
MVPPLGERLRERAPAIRASMANGGRVWAGSSDGDAERVAGGNGNGGKADRCILPAHSIPSAGTTPRDYVIANPKIESRMIHANIHRSIRLISFCHKISETQNSLRRGCASGFDPAKIVVSGGRSDGFKMWGRPVTSRNPGSAQRRRRAPGIQAPHRHLARR